MNVGDSLASRLELMARADIFNHGHLQVAAAYCRRLGLAGLVDRMVPTGMALRPGLVVQAMVLDTLSGRTPLYHCHLSYRYVACWTWRKKEIVIEVYYVGSRENAPY
jgi:hypothetical protein